MIICNRLRLMNKYSQHAQITVAGGRISPSVSDIDFRHSPPLQLQSDVEALRKRLAKRTFRISELVPA